TVKAKDAAGNQSLSLPTIVTTLDLNPQLESFTMRTVIANQRMPHDLVYGPDNKIWYTERFAGKVSFVDPVSGSKTVVLSLGSQVVNAGGQDGLLGLALHPQFMTGKPYAYISYTYQSVSSTVRKTRIARYTYNFNTQTLENPVTVLQDIPGSNDHNSARLAIGPDLKLYYSVGDMGAGQFDNLTRPNNAQSLSIYEGKILRLNTEPDGGGSWIPTDNPYGNAIYTLGHRNPQGLVWGNVNGFDRLYSSEHGPFSDDEINVIETGRNYGWPLVAGYCDGNYNGRNPGGPTIISEQDNCATLNVREPLRSLFPATNPPTGGDNLTWPSVAPSGTEFYGSNGIPGWQNSLLVAELKRGAVGRLKLSSDGLSIISDTIQYFQDLGRFRDVVVSPDGLKIYVACDSSGSTSGPTGNVITTPANPGSILEFTYSPPFITRAVTDTKETNDLHDLSIDVYPNPASNYFIIYNYKDAAGRSIALYDLNGRRLRHTIVSNLATRIETRNLSNGIYILKIYDKAGKAIRTEKIFINK
ncbi:MAG: PQQ-dependent sugar dehydrogenase, partial [Bacteroidota bacterium]